MSKVQYLFVSTGDLVDDGRRGREQMSYLRFRQDFEILEVQIAAFTSEMVCLIDGRPEAALSFPCHVFRPW